MKQCLLKDQVGMPKFMVPEYYDEEYNELLDIYAFGMCLMEMATCEYRYSKCTNEGQIFKKAYSGKKLVELGKVEDVELKELIDKCLLAMPSRPSTMELLDDPFFSSGIPMEIEHNNSQDMIMEEHGGDQYFGAKCCGMDDQILLVISASSKSILDANSSKRRIVFCESLVGDVSISSQITCASTLDSCFWVSKA